MTINGKLLAVLIIFILGYLALCLFYYLYQEKLIFHPEPLSEDYPFRFDVPFEEVWINTLDGEKINALHFKGEKPKGVVLYFHGNAGNLASWGTVASQFLDLDHDLLIMDYRGYGKSTGSFTEYKLHQDALACYQYLTDSGYNGNNILIYGRSIGSGIAARLANEKWNKGLVLESPFNNMASLASNYAPFLPHGLLLRYKFPVDHYVRHIRHPIHIIHGTDDEIISYDLAYQLKDQSDKVTFYTIEGGRHNDLGTFPEFHRIMGEIFSDKKR